MNNESTPIMPVSEKAEELLMVFTESLFKLTLEVTEENTDGYSLAKRNLINYIASLEPEDDNLPSLWEQIEPLMKDKDE